VARKIESTTPGSSGVTAAINGLDGVALVEKVTALVNSMPGRLPDSEGKPGGLVVFPKDIRPIIIGDLHANRENLVKILDHETNRADLESGKAACIFLGDVLHDDRTGHMKDMKSSVEILDDLFKVFLRYPGRVYYIRGNHDSFDERLRKSGICQGLECKNEMLDLLDMPPDTHFIVGHNPLWNDGNQIGVWLNVIGIKNHHILYSGSGSMAPYFTQERGELIVKTAKPKEAEVYYYG